VYIYIYILTPSLDSHFIRFLPLNLRIENNPKSGNNTTNIKLIMISIKRNINIVLVEYKTNESLCDITVCNIK